MFQDNSQSAHTNFLLLATCVLWPLGAISAPAHAQSVTLARIETTIGRRVNWAQLRVGEARDGFIADTLHNGMVKTVDGGDPQTTVGARLNFPFRVGVDGNRDTFTAHSGYNRVAELPGGGGTLTTLRARGVMTAYALRANKLADIFAVSRITISKQVPLGRIPSSRTSRIGTCVRFDPILVSKWLRGMSKIK
jgi:hypothetical protein